MASAPDLSSLTHDEKDALIVSLYATVSKVEEKLRKLETKLKKLEGQLAKNSSNSSKPSSTDGLAKPAPKTRRGRSGKRSGGQKGHDQPNLLANALADPRVRICARVELEHH